MAKKRFTAEQIVLMLREAEIQIAKGLKVPLRQPRRKRLWLNDGSCVRLRPAGFKRFILNREALGRTDILNRLTVNYVMNY